ncbi:MAG TPA: hypothetical protein VGK30_14555 [Candidatus Binatia bacterium]|jgi:hypothetical protein
MPRASGVVSRVQQHIAQRRPHLARSAQHPRMIAIVEDSPTGSGGTVDRARQPRADRHHSSTQSCGTTRFHDQMSMIPLQGILHQAKIWTLTAPGKRALDLSHDPNRAQRW